MATTRPGVAVEGADQAENGAALLDGSMWWGECPGRGEAWQGPSGRRAGSSQRRRPSPDETLATLSAIRHCPGFRGRGLWWRTIERALLGVFGRGWGRGVASCVSRPFPFLAR